MKTEQSSHIQQTFPESSSEEEWKYLVVGKAVRSNWGVILAR